MYMKFKLFFILLCGSIALISCKKHNCECTEMKTHESGVITGSEVVKHDVKANSKYKARIKCNELETTKNTICSLKD